LYGVDIKKISESTTQSNNMWFSQCVMSAATSSSKN